MFCLIGAACGAKAVSVHDLWLQVLSLEASLSAVHNERSQSDMGLKSRMQELLSELQSTLQVCTSQMFLTLKSDLPRTHT